MRTAEPGATRSMSAIPAAARYPPEREADVVLRDGATVHVRPVRADDGPAMRAFLESVSPDSIWFRFFGTPNLDWATSWSVNVDYADRFGLVVESGNPRAIIAHAAYVRIDDERAEVAFLVADAWQGRGISTILLAHLAEVAEQHGFSTFVRAGAAAQPPDDPGLPRERISGQAPVGAGCARGRAADIAVGRGASSGSRNASGSGRWPRCGASSSRRSVAVIGASRRRGTIGGEILHNLLAAEFSGAVYAVNDKADVVQSLPAYRSVGDIPGGVELAVVAVPAEQVVRAARECAAAGVRSLLVISSGFAETGAEGAGRQHELLEVCRDAGIRIVGPNCLGVLNTSPDVRLNATFAPPAAVPGRGRVHVPERRARDRDHRGGEPPRGRTVVVRLGWQQVRSFRQRLSPVLGAGPGHQAGAALPRVVRQPPEVRSDRPPGGGHQADPGGQERPVGRGRPRDLVAYRRDAVGLGRDRRCAVRAGRGDSDRHHARAVRRRRAAVGATRPARRPGRDRHQRWRARDPVRRRLPGGRGGDRGASGRRPSAARRVPARGARRSATRST